jgi:hypothetical protein
MLKPIDTYPAGGVDSRSNPINMPPGRYLYVRDLWPQQDGSFRLRDGYSQYVAGLQASVPIYSITPVVGPGPTYKPLIVFWQNKTPYVLDPSTLTITAPTVKGTAIASGARWSYFYTNGHLHAFNGTDAKWFDGVYWRDIGLPTLTAAQLNAIRVATGFEAPTVAQANAVALAITSQSSSTWVSLPGYLYLAFFDTAQNLLAPSPAPLSGSAYPVSGSANETLAITSLPSSTVATAVGLLSLQPSGYPGADFVLVRSLSSATLSGTGTTVTVTSTAHGLITGNVIALQIAAGNPHVNWSSEGPFAVTLIDANHFSFQVPDATDYTGACAVNLLLTIPNGTTSYTFPAPGFPTLCPQGLDQNNAGEILLPYANSASTALIAASTIGGTQPGYQFYASIYNLTTTHVGNRVAIGSRIANAAAAAFNLTGLPVFSDTEWGLLIGRTSDGAEIPYAVIDSNGNWISAANAQTTLTITQSMIDGNSELPSRNYPPPGTLDYNYQLSLLAGGAAQNPPVSGTFFAAWVESDHCCGAFSGQPTIYRSGSALDMREGVFVGLAEQCWDPADIETFPTGAPIMSGQGYQGESWVYTREDCGALMELAGETSWQGPWNVGCAGQYAWTKGWQNMPFWVTGDKQLATVSGGGYLQMGGLMTTAASGPILISDEYEAALLSQIGSAYLAEVEVIYIRKPAERIDVLRIHARDVNGNPLTIIHDFNLRDQQSPYGQGYLEAYQSVLSTAPAPTFALVRDQNWQLQVLAGASNGNLYELYDGSSDNGSNFTGQALALIYVGPERTAIKYLEWYGDQSAEFFVTRDLTTAFDPSKMQALCADTPAEVQGDENAAHWTVPIKDSPEMIHAYLLLQLTSHPADGSVGLNSPPHIPLETYGRVWLVSPLAGVSRGK